MTFKLSIVTINYNNLIGLKKTIESVVNQSYREFEFVVIDGGSEDGSKEIIEVHQSKINYWVSEKDKGIYQAMNKGIRASSGEYILFLNSGDVLLDDTETLNKVVLNLKQKGLYYAPIFLSQNGIIKNRADYPENINEKFAFTNTICQQAIIYHASLFCDNFFDEKLKYISDWKMHFSLFKRKTKFIHLSTPFAIYDLEGLTSKGDTKYTSHKERLKTQFLDFFLHFLKYYGTNRRVFIRLLKIFIKVD
ncbi:glycosyltransferase family 2 protein [Flavobacterium flavigenum]|uniref:glycosyltransferase family 2 protein n=1 Tax=Flavobacterium flavigenum TaxID=3003258 RepID=UPI0024822169|nr:glycosyltransferase family 2 protein [Flavobacterium flavigenum]